MPPASCHHMAVDTSYNTLELFTDAPTCSALVHTAAVGQAVAARAAVPQGWRSQREESVGEV